MKKITALLITLNGERTLRACLDSLSFCDQILIVDSFSTDATGDIARSHGAIFIQNPFPGYFEQIRHGMDWLAEHSPTEWVLFLDCDEICSEELRASVLAAIEHPENNTAFSVSRRTWYYNRFLLHGGAYPDRLFRLFKPEGIRLSECHGHPVYLPTGRHKDLQGDLLHFSNSSFFNHMEKLNLYAQRGADSMKKSGRQAGLAAGIGHALWRFFSDYCIKLGALDGKAGFIWAAHNSFYTFLKYIRVNEGTEGAWGIPAAGSATKKD